MTLRTARQKLRQAFPISRRVVLTVGACDDGNAAETWMDGETIRIAIDDTLDPAAQLHFLAHEWAHARIFDRYGKQCERHTNEWCKEFAAIYRHFFDA
jgi:hypothetical protein